MDRPCESPLVFEVAGAPVVGVLHRPVLSPKTAIVMVAAGGPQYRAGCGRQLLIWARKFTQAGIAVLRFDYRGMGDSGGEFKGFTQIDDDLKAAIDLFERECPEVEEIVLWGGCNAASAAMIYAWQDPRVKRIIALNPWAHSEAVGARLQVKHYYLKRLRQKSFWLKLLKGKLNPVKSSVSLLRAVGKMRQVAPAGLAPQPSNAVPEAAGTVPASTVTPLDDSGLNDAAERVAALERMRLGLERFSGPVLLVLSGQSLIGREFDETVAASPGWQKAVAGSEITRREIPDAGHTFATRESQDAVFETALSWLQRSP